MTLRHSPSATPMSRTFLAANLALVTPIKRHLHAACWGEIDLEVRSRSNLDASRAKYGQNAPGSQEGAIGNLRPQFAKQHLAPDRIGVGRMLPDRPSEEFARAAPSRRLKSPPSRSRGKK